MNTVRNSARKTVTTAVRENDVTRKTRKPTIYFYFSLIYLILNYCMLFKISVAYCLAVYIISYILPGNRKPRIGVVMNTHDKKMRNRER